MLLKTYVWSIAMYGCETCTFGEAEKNRLEAFEMCYKKLIKEVEESEEEKSSDVRTPVKTQEILRDT